MRLEWWRAGPPHDPNPVDETHVFGYNKSKILLVENQAEYDLAYALQFIYGSGCHIKIAESTDLASLVDYRGRFSRVYVSWDPLDPNRI